jgi:antitoxin ParD1/3/4
MSISLTPEQEAFVGRAVASGQFASPEAVVAEAITLLKQRLDKHERLKHDIEIGLASGDAGELDEDSIADVKARGRARLAAKLAAE